MVAQKEKEERTITVKQALRVMVESEYFKVDDDTFELIFDAYVNSPHILAFSEEMGKIIEEILLQEKDLDEAFEQEEDSDFDADEIYINLDGNPKRIIFTPYKN